MQHKFSPRGSWMRTRRHRPRRYIPFPIPIYTTPFTPYTTVQRIVNPYYAIYINNERIMQLQLSPNENTAREQLMRHFPQAVAFDIDTARRTVYITSSDQQLLEAVGLDIGKKSKKKKKKEEEKKRDQEKREKERRKHEKEKDESFFSKLKRKTIGTMKDEITPFIDKNVTVYHGRKKIQPNSLVLVPMSAHLHDYHEGITGQYPSYVEQLSKMDTDTFAHQIERYIIPNAREVLGEFTHNTKTEVAIKSVNGTELFIGGKKHRYIRFGNTRVPIEGEPFSIKINNTLLRCMPIRGILSVVNVKK